MRPRTREHVASCKDSAKVQVGTATGRLDASAHLFFSAATYDEVLDHIFHIATADGRATREATPMRGGQRCLLVTLPRKARLPAREASTQYTERVAKRTRARLSSIHMQGHTCLLMRTAQPEPAKPLKDP